jgi:hypothetical protein
MIKRWLDSKVASGESSTRSEAIVYYPTAEMVRREQQEVDLQKMKQNSVGGAPPHHAWPQCGQRSR